jgi:hypothetical protein
VTNLAHSASFHSKEKIAPSNSGIKHLGLADANAGRVSVAADVFARLEAKYLAIVATHT